MPIIKQYDISSVEEIKEIKKSVEELQEEKRYLDYTTSNIMLVRITNVFPKNKVVTPLSDTAVLYKTEFNFLCNSLRYQLTEEQLKSMNTYIVAHRSTTHFTENGIVVSHLYGNFNNQDFIILEPLEEQLRKADFRCFAGQDTFIKGSMKLSDKTIIIIREEKYQKLLEDNPELNNFNIILYKGISAEDKKAYEDNPENGLASFYTNDERAVVEQALMDLGYVPELIGQSYIINSPTSEKIRKLNNQLATDRGVLSNTLHCHTPEYKADLMDDDKIREIYDLMLLDFIIKINGLDKNLFYPINIDTAYKLVNLIGIDGLISCVSKFNMTLNISKNKKLLPNSRELLSGVIPDIYDFYKNLVDLDMKVKR